MKMAMESAFSFTIREGYRTILMNSTTRKVGYIEQKKLAAAVNKIGANINSSHLILLL